MSDDPPEKPVRKKRVKKHQSQPNDHDDDWLFYPSKDNEHKDRITQEEEEDDDKESKPLVKYFRREPNDERKFTLPNEIEIDGKLIEDLIKQLMGKFSFETLGRELSGKPKIMGFQMRIDGDGDHRITKLPDNFAFDDFKNLFGESKKDEVTIDIESDKVIEPQSDLIEEPDAYYLTIDLPGFNRDDLQLSVSDNRVRVFASAEGVTYKKSFDLSSPVDRSKVKAKYKNGILDICLPKQNPDIDHEYEIGID